MKFKLGLLTIAFLFFCTLSSFKLHATIVVGSPVVNYGGSYNPITNTFVVCQEQPILFTYTCYSTNNEAIMYDPAGTNLTSYFSDVAIFVSYPNAGFEDVIEVYLSITPPIPTEPFNGVYEGLTVGLASASENGSIEFNLLVPGSVLSASDVEFCSNTPQSVQLSVTSNSNDVDLDPTSIIWSGPGSAQIIDPTNINTMVNIDALNLNESLTFTCLASTVPDPVTGSICSFTNTITLTAGLLGHNVVQTVTSCDSYTWIDGITYFSSENSATHLLTNEEGCDSLVNLDLTIFTTPMVDLMFSLVECDNFILPELSVGNYYTESGGMGTQLDAGESITSTQEIYIYAANGQCSNENSFMVMINESPVNTISETNNILTATATGSSYQWLDCDNQLEAIDGETDQSFSPAANGNYAVEITQNGCSVVSDCEAITTLNTIEAIDQKILISPNPSDGIFTFESDKIGMPYSITDNTGRHVRNGFISENATFIDLQDHSQGFYFLNIEGISYILIKE